MVPFCRLQRAYGAAVDQTIGEKIERMGLDASINAVSVRGGTIALGNALDCIHAFESEEFVSAEGVVCG
jgi:hypothetical protein